MRARQRRLERVEFGVDEIAQIADHRASVARQDVERIGERFAGALAGIGGVDDLVAQSLQRLVEALLRHLERTLARPRQEVRHESVEPHVVVAGAGGPQAEGAVGILAVHLAVDRQFDAAVEIGVDRQMLDRGELVGVEQRHRAADRLFRAAVGIALERLQQGGGVEPAERRGGQRYRPGARNEVSEEIARDRLARPRRQRMDQPAIEVGRARDDPEREMLGDIEVGPGQPEIEAGDVPMPAAVMGIITEVRWCASSLMVLLIASACATSGP